MSSVRTADHFMFSADHPRRQACLPCTQQLSAAWASTDFLYSVKDAFIFFRIAPVVQNTSRIRSIKHGLRGKATMATIAAVSEKPAKQRTMLGESGSKISQACCHAFWGVRLFSRGLVAHAS
ncbi:MAG: hypothetical protein FRX49_07662 [Trebouxia sp. A1-2]|nr:MAG: hypothetical protein FRX49_07662 [Trebouxia sp. A1-2]